MPSPRVKRWIRRGALAATLVGSMFVLENQIRRVVIKPVKTHTPVLEKVEQRNPTTRPVEIRPNPSHAKPALFEMPKQPLHFSEIPKGNYCTMYARLAAEKLFKVKYSRGDAWDFAQRNKSVWKGSGDNPKEIALFLRPGQVIGLFNPSSKYNQPGRAYTHTALYVGSSGGEHWVMQRIGTNDRLETLESFLTHNPGWKIKELIEPE
ncbi:MAG: hypothetical protein AABW68_00875 [archaeon]